MPALINFATLLLHSILAFFRSRKEQAFIELALRQQLAIYTQTRSKPKLTPLDRAFWVALFRFWPRWKEVLVIVKPDTVVRWHRKGFRLYWRRISKRGPGRPRIPVEVQALINRFALKNGWGARKGQCRAWEARLHREPRNRLALSLQEAARPRQTAALAYVS